MTTLYKRATPRQDKVIRMIEGACRNASHAHPKWKFDPRLARSIAKRATGTLTAQWPDVLAAQAVRSESDGGVPPLSTVVPEPALLLGRRSRGASDATWRTSLWCLFWAVGAAAKDARKNGAAEREGALTDVLRCINGMLEGPVPARKDRFLVGRSDV